jgi:protein phosphatase
MRVTQIDYLHETGAKRNQEDFLFPLPGTASEKDRIFIVCDGVGGSESGEVASQYIAEWVAQGLHNAPESKVGLPLINGLLEEARARLVEHALLKGLGKDMATTFTLLYLLQDQAYIAWCGDSRVYHLRGDRVLYRTTDHSLVHSLVRTGELSEEDAREHPQRNLLLKAIRADEPGPEAEGHWVEDIREGDYFLLCTDGLLENISDADLLFLLKQSEDREMYLAKAFRNYCHNKTRDNYSMYLIRVNPGDSHAAAGPDVTVAAETAGRGRAGWILLLVVVLIVAAAFVMRGDLFVVKRVLGRPVRPGSAVPSGPAAPAVTSGSVGARAGVSGTRLDSAKIQTLVPTAASAKDTITP